MDDTTLVHVESHSRSSAPGKTCETFHKFCQLPPELRIMIWEAFYAEPRFFRARRRLPDLEQGPSWALQVDGPLQAYYDSIDTEIDSFSSSIAARLRPRYHLPTGSERPVNINWAIDFVCLPGNDSYFRNPWAENYRRFLLPNTVTAAWIQVAEAPLADLAVWEQADSWWSEIQNLVLPTMRDCTEKHYSITKSNLWLWKNREKLPRLKRLRQVWDCAALPELESEANMCIHDDDFEECTYKHCILLPALAGLSYFQTKYFLKAIPWTPRQWRSLQLEMVSKQSWQGPAKELAWSAFVKTLTTSLVIRNPDIHDKLVWGDETDGCEALFGWLLQKAIRKPRLLGAYYPQPLSLE